MWRAQVGKLGEQIGVGSYLVPRYLSICESGQKCVGSVVGKCSATVRKGRWTCGVIGQTSGSIVPAKRSACLSKKKGLLRQPAKERQSPASVTQASRPVETGAPSTIPETPFRELRFNWRKVTCPTSRLPCKSLSSGKHGFPRHAQESAQTPVFRISQQRSECLSAGSSCSSQNRTILQVMCSQFS